jgi:aryl-alcohol dehydrogenase-like predicted oxidoreductase
MPLIKKKLGWSDVEVSAVCLGTMTMGVQSNEEESHKLLDYYVEERGGNFLDVAEMYPAPASDPRWMPGTSEEILGRWFAKKPEVRSKVVLATKVMGFSPGSDSAGNRKITLGTGGKIGEV